MGVKFFWASYLLGPKIAMHFWKGYYLALITCAEYIQVLGHKVAHF